ncbi:hypothetical protein L1987_04828 [Smallanthus sonchifolius]|uniref:Uncharacterized protein n=1 Tax=Smallanthus sonchifolius TaxID=185202 RepID=A0ACB9JTN6_9ASTR|nr:hypothetical protein L1987_04828 [Smallanthus sonchifolius]
MYLLEGFCLPRVNQILKIYFVSSGEKEEMSPKNRPPPPRIEEGVGQVRPNWPDCISAQALGPIQTHIIDRCLQWLDQ